VKNIDQMETVLLKVIETTPDNVTPAVKDYFTYKKSEMMLSYYMAALIKDPNKKRGRQLAKEFDNKIRALDVKTHESTRTRYKACLLLSYFSFADKLKHKLQGFGFYKRVVRLIRR